MSIFQVNQVKFQILYKAEIIIHPKVSLIYKLNIKEIKPTDLIKWIQQCSIKHQMDKYKFQFTITLVTIILQIEIKIK